MGLAKLTNSEFSLLEYKNRGLVFSFLLYYGRTAKVYSPDNAFFDFIEDIENDNICSKYFPYNLLYKFEIQYLRGVDSIQSIESFLTIIEQKTVKKDLQDFLKATYLKSVIEWPFYWTKHEKLLTTKSIKEAVIHESKNIYADLINKASGSFYASQNGAKGFNFTANKLDGTEFRLSDVKGKIVVIDMWATWCAPCIVQRPNMLAIASKYHDNPDVAILMVSVDNSVDRWQKYVKKANGQGYGLELNIPNGMNTEFGDKYLIKAVPRYFLIGKEGVIVDAHLPEPSIEMEQRIERERKL